MQIRVYATLRQITNAASISLEHGPGDTFRALVDELIATYPAMQKELFNGNGELNTGIHILLDGRDIRYLGGLDSTIPHGAEIRIFPAVGGG